ncbi:hypothetical protein F8M41_014789 [Gigaspora margarita]|uniref:Uncharacterized protein n=1 Tax=Gigaspora margarita TaxID=4874 RepID=A0A8H4ENN7_GIGMA|nr:hypothetical protein F8M41_014789 [Gigaspora margarita]
MDYTFRIYFLILLMVPCCILTLVCPILEFEKISLFEKTNGELKLIKTVEYAYLIITIVIAAINVFACLCCSYFRYGELDFKNVFSTITWLMIPATYTYITANEMGDIPFSCPSDYPYTSTIIKDACQIRSANLVCMWLYFINLILLILVACSIRSKGTNHKSSEALGER